MGHPSTLAYLELIDLVKERHPERCDWEGVEDRVFDDPITPEFLLEIFGTEGDPKEVRDKTGRIFEHTARDITGVCCPEIMVRVVDPCDSYVSVGLFRVYRNPNMNHFAIDADPEKDHGFHPQYRDRGLFTRVCRPLALKLPPRVCMGGGIAHYQTRRTLASHVGTEDGREEIYLNTLVGHWLAEMGFIIQQMAYRAGDGGVQCAYKAFNPLTAVELQPLKQEVFARHGLEAR